MTGEELPERCISKQWDNLSGQICSDISRNGGIRYSGNPPLHKSNTGKMVSHLFFRILEINQSLATIMKHLRKMTIINSVRTANLVGFKFALLPFTFSLAPSKLPSAMIALKPTAWNHGENHHLGSHCRGLIVLNCLRNPVFIELSLFDLYGDCLDNPSHKDYFYLTQLSANRFFCRGGRKEGCLS